jgi:uncharacterized protein (DUF952 family)
MSDIYKVLTEEEWHAATKSGQITTSLDEEDGFVHFSTSKQLALTLHLYFKDQKKVVLLQIDKENIKDNLVFEKASSERRIGTFPHLYGKLTTQDVINTWCLDRCGFELPKQVLVESEKK